MPTSLAKKFAGLPRWAWIAILAGGLTVGLVLRYRSEQAAADATDTTDTGLDDSGLAEDQLLTDGYDPYSFSTFGGTIPYPPGSGQGGSPTFVTPPTPDPRIPCTSAPPSVQVEGYKWICKGGYWEMTPTGHVGVPCDTAPAPPPTGFQWKCVGGHWQLEPTHAPPPPTDHRVSCRDHGPPYKPTAGHHWECDKDGYWALVPNKRHGGGHHKPPPGHHHKKCGKKPTHDPPPHKHWACVNGHWVPRQGTRGPDEELNPDEQMPVHVAPLTGGGSPITRAIHFPDGSGLIAGM